MLRFVCVFTFVLIMFTFTNSTKAENSLVFGGVSHHFISDDTNNSFHRALVLNYEDYLIGYLRNSYNQDSFVAAYRVYKDVKKDHTTEIYLGAVRGYDKCYGKFERESSDKKIIACPLITINVTIETDTKVKPMLSLWGDALVLTGKYNF